MQQQKHSAKLCANIYFALLLLFTNLTIAQITRTSTGSTDWNTASTWSPAGIPAAGDIIIIRSGHIVTVNTTPANTVASVTFNNFSISTSGLTVANGVTLNVAGLVTLQNAPTLATNASISGGGTLICGSLSIGFPTTTSANGSNARLNTLTLTINTLTVSGNIRLNNDDQGGGDSSQPNLIVNSPCNLSANTLVFSHTGNGFGGATRNNFTLGSGASLSLSSANPIQATGWVNSNGNIQTLDPTDITINLSTGSSVYSCGTSSNPCIWNITSTPICAGTPNYSNTTVNTTSSTTATGGGAPLSISGTTTICNGISTILTATGGTLGSGSQIQWFIGSCGGTSVGTGASITVAPSTTTTYFVRYSGSCNTTACASTTVTVNPTPVITTQPSIPAAVCAGSSTTNLSVTATGATTYIWRRNGVSLTNSGIYSGVNTATLTITNPTIAENGAVYTVVVGNASGCPVTSIPITLSVNAIPAPLLEFTQGGGDITANISACGTIVGGGQNDIDIVASTNPGGSSTYQWQVSLNNGVTWINAPGPTASAAAYILDPIYAPYQTSAGAYRFRVIVTNNGCSGTSNVGTLNVSGVSNLTSGVVGGNQSSCASFNPAAFTQTTAPTGGTGTYTYQWESSTDNINFSLIAGANAATFDAPTISQTTYYRRRVVSGGCFALSNTITVSITSLTITPAATALSVCFSGTLQSSSLTYSVTAASPITYSISWNATPSNSFLAVTDAALTGSPLPISVPANTAPGTYTGTIIVKSGLCISTPKTFTITVNPLPIAPTSITGNTTICSGSSTTLTHTGGTADPGAIVQWFTDTCGGTPVGIGNSITVSPTTNTTYFVRYRGTCGTTTCASATVTVNSLSIAPTSISGTSTICSGDSTSLTVIGGFAATGATAQWYSGSCGGTLLGTGNSIIVSPISTTNYFVRYSGSCNSTTCATITIVVNTPQTITLQPRASQTTCSGSSVSFSINTAGTVSSYQWYNGTTMLTNTGTISGANTATLTINAAAPSDVSSNYYCEVTGPCARKLNSNNAELIVNEKVTITNQPQPTQTFCTGTTATFSIVATGTGLSYQWYKGLVALTDGGNISGATSATLTLASLALSDASNQYKCVVSGSSPCATLTSNNAALIVNQSAIITIQPTATQTICADSFANFSLNATGGGLTYQWYKGATMLADGGYISGATTSSLTLNPITLADAATDYYCVVSNGCAAGLSSNNAALVIYETPFIYDQTLTVCSEDVFNYTITNGLPTIATVVPNNTTYTWPAPIMTGGMTGGTDGMNLSSISQTLDNPTSSPQTATYFITPTSGTTGSCIGSSFSFVVTVNPKPAINNITAAFCSNENFSFTPVNGGGNLVPVGTTYSWGIPLVTGGMTGGSAGTAQTSINQTLINTTNSEQTASYTVTASSGTCAASTFSVIVTIYPKPTVSGSILTQSICSGNAIASIVISNPNGISGSIDYSWTRDNTSNTIGIASSGNSSIISGSLSNLTDTPQTTNFTLLATSDEDCASNPVNVSVTVNPKPTVNATPINQTICSGNAITPIVITNPNAIAGTTFTWTRNNSVNLTGIPSSGTTTPIIGSLTNITNTTQTTTFTITAVSNGCSTTVNTISITVNPRPTLTALPLTQTVCGSSPFGTIVITNPNSVVGTAFTWTRNNTINVTGLANSGSGAAISGTLTNNTNSNQTVTFTITALAGSCPSDIMTVDVVVLPTPLITVTPSTQTRCHLQAITTLNFGNSNAVLGTTYSWTRDNTTNLTGIPASGNGASLSGTFSNNTTSSQTTIFTITASAPNGCSSTTTASITVYPPLVAPTINAPQTVCVSSNPSLLTITTPASGGSGVYTYQWQSSGDDITYNNIGGATSSTYQPPLVNAGTNNTYYRLIANNTCGSVTSNVIFVEVVNGGGFTFNFNSGLTVPICSGSTFTPSINSAHLFTSAVRFTWNADPTYITPGSGGPTGTTGGRISFVRNSTANIGPLTAVNNTNATVVTSVSVIPDVYNFPGPPSGSFICSTSPQIFNVTIRPIPVATATGNNTTICNVGGPGISVSGNITDANMTFNWTRNNTVNVTGTNSGSSGNIAFGNTYTINPILTNTTAFSQIVKFTITPSSNGCNGTPVDISITVAPTVTAGVISANQTICNGGDPAAFTQTTAATGLNLTYQWQSSINNTTYTDITAATGNTYDSGILTQNTWFRRVVTSTVNGTSCFATSTPILITVNTLNPGSVTGDQTICDGGNPNAFASVAATGAGVISYQWQSNTTGCNGSWNNILGANIATYDIPAGLSITTYYRRMATSTLNSVACVDYSNCIIVSVNTITGGTIAGDQTLCGNNPAAFTETLAAIAVGTVSYQWQSNTTGCGGLWTNINGATSATYDAPAGLVVTTYYQRVTTSTLNGVVCSANSNCITVTANSISPGTISGNRTICNGGDPTAFTVTVAATGTNLSYQWQVSTTSSAGPWSDILSATNQTYDAPGPITQTTYFRRVAKSSVNSTSCSANSNFVTVFVNTITPPTINGDQNISETQGNPAAFTNTTPATGSGTLSYQWQSSTVGCEGPWANIVGATAATFGAPNTLTTTYYRVVVTSALNSVLCTAISNCLTITNLRKTWTGSVNTDWSVDENWLPAGVPTSNDYIVIRSAPNTTFVNGTNYSAYGKSLKILAGGALEVSSNNAIIISDVVDVDAGGSFYIRNGASLVQVNNLPNIGKVTIEKTTQPMYRYDYTYWGSPVTLASNYTLGMLSPLTLGDKYFSWIPSVANGFGNWSYESAATIMDPRKGYIVRAPQTFSYTADVKIPYTTNFVGTPNNGDIYCPIYFGALPLDNSNDKYNLLSNPYASAVDAELFLNDPANTSIIDGTVYFWTHNSQPSASNLDPFYGDFIINYSPNDYASWNLLGGTGTTTGTGSGGGVPNGFIASGQGFFAKSMGTATSGDAVVFKNSMRVNFNNDLFFRNSIVNANTDRSLSITREKHRLWLNLINQGGSFNQILVGYADGASNAYDRAFDGVRITDNSNITLYSMVQDKNLVIQGKALPFSDLDQVPLGYKSTLNDTFSIRIDHFDGLFDNQNIYLEDRLLHVIHDLKLSPYVFTSGIGTFDDRFVLRYTNGLLGVSNPTLDSQIAAYLSNEKLVIHSGELLSEVSLYDISGKLILTEILEFPKKNFETIFHGAEGVYIAKIKLENGLIVTKKLIHKLNP